MVMIVMNKSDFLDELRLHIGAAYDYANTREEFIRFMIEAVYEKTDQELSFTLSRSSNGILTTILSLGEEKHNKEQNRLGEGFFLTDKMLSAGYINKGAEHVFYVPIPIDGRTSYFVTVQFTNHNYIYTREDRIFISEVLQFIHVKQSTLR
ncbi:hypothetical protein SAMN05444126_1515 [Salisediminibacterium halotolerans]|uniref:Uncharacterized protein n=2 Tax=Salisediminibacterium halotolerans TaxID=517425 RepID=A0A1H9WVF5_9BACI|nr:hypothetical protein SAMN05444126_1515 [Salisediminibacterium haloalkalitolerans]